MNRKYVFKAMTSITAFLASVSLVVAVPDNYLVTPDRVYNLFVVLIAWFGIYALIVMYNRRLEYKAKRGRR